MIKQIKIYRTDNTVQVINVTKEFNVTERKGKQLITPLSKADDIAHDIAGRQYLRHELI
jgi:hypothetical protein